jgi:hypothetical protein
MARVLFLHGVIAAKNTVETLASNLIGGYVGYTRRAVQVKMEEARGGVLFIDEAYELGKGSFGDEAVGQLLEQSDIARVYGRQHCGHSGGLQKGHAQNA